MTQPILGQFTPPVSIIAVGATTAVGYRASTTAASVRAGIKRFEEHPFMVDSRGEPYITAHAQYLPDDTEGMERMWELGLSAANEALGAVSNSLYGNTNLPLLVGLPNIRPGFSEQTARQIEARFKESLHPLGRFSHIETFCKGRSAGLMAMEKGCRMITRGSAPLCLVGGMDSWINPYDLQWLDYKEMLHSTSNPWGLIPGEGAGFCLLASESTLRSNNIQAMAHILAGISVQEKNLVNSDTVCTAQGLTQAISLVTQDSILPQSDKIDQIICDLNGLRHRADELGFAMAKTAQRFKAPGDFLAPADYWGDVCAASGPLFIALAVQTALHGREKGPLHLILTGSDTGERCAMLIKTIKQQGANE